MYESLLLQEITRNRLKSYWYYYFAERKFLITEGTIMQEKYQKQERICPTKMQISNHFKS